MQLVQGYRDIWAQGHMRLDVHDGVRDPVSGMQDPGVGCRVPGFQCGGVEAASVGVHPWRSMLIGRKVSLCLDAAVGVPAELWTPTPIDLVVAVWYPRTPNTRVLIPHPGNRHVYLYLKLSCTFTLISGSRIQDPGSKMQDLGVGCAGIPDGDDKVDACLCQLVGLVFIVRGYQTEKHCPGETIEEALPRS